MFFCTVIVTFATKTTWVTLVTIETTIMEKEDQFGSYRLKYKTIAELKKLKLNTEASLGHELSNDEFVQMLIKIAMNKK